MDHNLDKTTRRRDGAEAEVQGECEAEGALRKIKDINLLVPGTRVLVRTYVPGTWYRYLVILGRWKL